MIVIYAFVAFLFFKIFPEFAGYQSNTVVGALVMASVSALIMQAAEWAAAWRIGIWVQQLPGQGDKPSGLLLIAALAVLTSAGTTFLVGVGFSDGLMRSAFKGFRADPVLFWVMAALPPLVHVVTRMPTFMKVAALYRPDKADDDLNNV